MKLLFLVREVGPMGDLLREAMLSLVREEREVYEQAEVIGHRSR